MLKQIVCVLFFAIFLKANAQNYKASLIPDSLKEDANAVKRIEEIKIIIKGTHKAIIKHKYAYTILNESGDRLAYYSGYYDKFRSISDISGILFDADGNKIKSIKKRDIMDVSISDGFSIATDARAKQFSFLYKTYPYTVEYEDEVELDGTYQFPKWMPVQYSKMGVEYSSLQIEAPADYELRYKQLNYSAKHVVVNKKDVVTYFWEIKNLKAIESEVWQPEWREVTPNVLIAPTVFEYAGYKGSMATWKELGLFQKALNVGKDELPNNIKQSVHELTDRLNTTQEKVNALYEFVQKNTRYISIQLGIGGLMPFEAKFVAEKKYGDCKALSNYMVSLLKEAGIKGYYTWVAAGEDEAKNVVEDFPGDYFNHIITCVPNGKDTIWLECTSQTKSPGYMGSFTGNRKALMIGDDGGYLINTPVYSPKDNAQNRRVDAYIDKEGTLIANVKTIFSGIQQELQHDLIYTYNDDQRKKYLNNYISLPTYVVEKNDYKEVKGAVPVIEENLKIVSANYANITAKRLFVTPNLFNRGSKLPNIKPRKFDIEYDFSFIDVDTINIRIPDGYEPEAIPKNVDINNKFGSYSIHFLVTGTSIEMIRRYTRNEAKYPASDYTDLVKFYDEMFKADRSRIVMLKKE